LFKGGILNSWNKKIAVALNKCFFETLPPLKKVSKEEADIVWMIYDLKLTTGSKEKNYVLTKVDEVYTEFEPALLSITTPNPGKLKDFINTLQNKLDTQLEIPPVNKTIEPPF
jgi:hypothetical protein